MSLLPILPPSTARSFAAVGLEPELPAIRRRPDGGIDFDWYLLRARRLRSRSYADAFGAAVRGIGRVLAAVAKAMRERRQRRRALAELLNLDDRALRDLGLNRAGIFFAVDHGREDVPAVANVNDKPARSPRVA
ncbi:MAG TPA: DUF1127 domain-containing protein [Alphaproteobacteria bacterium]|jgi:uncharacterized protein YjiS (DUF1127 family)